MEAQSQPCRDLMIAINQLNGLYYRAARTLGIGEGVFVLFYALADGNAHSQKKICAEWLLPPHPLNSTVKKCLKDGYIQLVPLGHREKEIVLTEKGKAFAEAMLFPIFRAEKQVMNLVEDAAFIRHFQVFTQALAHAFQQTPFSEKSTKGDTPS